METTQSNELTNEQPKHYLSTRENWQKEANASGAAHENFVEAVFKTYFSTADGEGFEYVSKPKILDQCFLEYQYKKHPDAYDFPLDPVKDDIYYDTEKKRFLKWTGLKWTDAKEGMIPDGLIRNKSTGKSICVEDKHQNDAGNAQERACKYATPKVEKAIQEKLGITYAPVCWIFHGSLADKAKYKHEVAFCLPEELYIMISPKDDKETKLLEWFNRCIRPLLV